MRSEKITVKVDKYGTLSVKGRMSNRNLIEAANSLTAFEINRRQNPKKKRRPFKTIRKFFRTLYKMSQPPQPERYICKQRLLIEAHYAE